MDLALNIAKTIIVAFAASITAVIVAQAMEVVLLLVLYGAVMVSLWDLSFLLFAVPLGLYCALIVAPLAWLLVRYRAPAAFVLGLIIFLTFALLMAVFWATLQWNTGLGERLALEYLAMSVTLGAVFWFGLRAEMMSVRR
jgi:hypothetical protein